MDRGGRAIVGVGVLKRGSILDRMAQQGGKIGNVVIGDSGQHIGKLRFADVR
jgi:hypothetical protein